MSESSRQTGLIVAKLGSSTLVDANGDLDRGFVADLCDQVAQLVSEGNRVILVSSGAAAVGVERLGMPRRPSDLPSLQACAAAGQAALIETYAAAFAAHGIVCAQVLLTRQDVSDRSSYLNARTTFAKLIELGVVPIVNENDVTSIREFSFGDNDMLGAIVSTLVDADEYVIMSDIDGLYSQDPTTHPDATLIEVVDHVDQSIIDISGGAGSAVGTGGMRSKVRAGQALLAAGIPMTICKGRREHALVDAVHGSGPHTRFVPSANQNHETARKLWIGLAGMPQGSIVVDDGAEAALVEHGASLLPVGITEVRGSFARGDVVGIVSTNGELLGRGIVRYSSEELGRVRGLKLDVIARFMPDSNEQPAIHRDELLIF